MEVTGPRVIEKTVKGKWRCSVCGLTGTPGGRWAWRHMAGHPIACVCGRRFTSVVHRGAHVGKQRCYDKPEGEKHE